MDPVGVVPVQGRLEASERAFAVQGCGQVGVGARVGQLGVKSTMSW